ncbi:hypothetical protein NE237_023535 [Protea cynaroides]|uniref:Endoglucanase n=1 Tax=Protea cynaroides TaxID=273540 RepID=A0A9Q0HE71_9MAGN|nr:hypothetical protein NE237_023535 [Protea cynaroides]
MRFPSPLPLHDLFLLLLFFLIVTEVRWVSSSRKYKIGEGRDWKIFSNCLFHSLLRGHDYQDALSKCILFFEGQRSGSLLVDQRMIWRGPSALGDGSAAGVDLTGGYYDAGDNIKFGFPMAFTTTLLAWSIIEFGDSMPPSTLREALDATRWGSDYLLKTVAHPDRIFEFLEGSEDSLASYKVWVDSFMCTLVPESSSPHEEYTPGGLIYKPRGCNMQPVAPFAFLQLVYVNYLSHSSQNVNCSGVIVGPSSLHQLAKRQVDYILGDNPMDMSYMVGYGSKYPQHIHHRGSSSASIKDHPQFIAWKEGTVYYNSSNPNPNVLVGAVVGGPGKDDFFKDDWADPGESEPTTYVNALWLVFLRILLQTVTPIRYRDYSLFPTFYFHLYERNKRKKGCLDFKENED